jgi:excinuclease ABC subunit B
VQLLRDLRRGVFDALIGINLLREGLDLPEVSLVAVLDADKEGFLRSETALVQTAGRAARNIDGKVILYADVMTGSIRRAIEETGRRRLIQREYNIREGITPEGIKKGINDVLASIYEADYGPVPSAADGAEEYVPLEEAEAKIVQLEAAMKEAAAGLEFEKAAELRDRVRELKWREVLPGAAGLNVRLPGTKRGKARRKKGRKT